MAPPAPPWRGAVGSGPSVTAGTWLTSCRSSASPPLFMPCLAVHGKPFVLQGLIIHRSLTDRPEKDPNVGWMTPWVLFRILFTCIYTPSSLKLPPLPPPLTHPMGTQHGPWETETWENLHSAEDVTWLLMTTDGVSLLMIPLPDDTEATYCNLLIESNCFGITEHWGVCLSRTWWDMKEHESN